MLQWLGGLAQVGIYSVGWNIGLVISLIVTAFQSAWIPYFMSFAGKPAEARITFGRVLTNERHRRGHADHGRVCPGETARPVDDEAGVPCRVDGRRPRASAQFLAGVYAILLPGIVHLEGSAVLRRAAGNRRRGRARQQPRSDSGVRHRRSGGVVGGQLLRAGNGAVGLEPVSSISGRFITSGGRLARFAVAFVCFAAATLWERDASLPKEVLYSGLLVCLLPLIAYQQLEVEERRYVWNGPLRAFRIGLPAGEPPEVANERQRLSR